MAVVTENTNGEGWHIWQVRLDADRIGDVDSYVCENCDWDSTAVGECCWLRLHDGGYVVLDLCDSCQRLAAAVLGPDAIVRRESAFGKLLEGALAAEQQAHERAKPVSPPAANLDELPF